MKQLKILCLAFVVGAVGLLILNPVGICRRHDLLYERTTHTIDGQRFVVVMDQCGWEERGRLLFLRNSYWGSPYRVLVFLGASPKDHRIANVSLHDDETGEGIGLVEDRVWSRGGKTGNREAWYASIKTQLSYHGFTLSFDVETLDNAGSVVGRSSYRIGLTKAYRTYWAVDALDALMSV